MKKKPQTPIEIVNCFLEKSFGKGFFGNGVLFRENEKTYMIKGDRLESIAKPKWPYIPKLNEQYEVAGKFISQGDSSPDGSRLNVSRKYLNAAERYATNYFLHFKKNVCINGKEFLVPFNG
jgi:hypothetical protein